MTDLTFLEDGNPDKIEGLISWSKRAKIAEVKGEEEEEKQRFLNIVRIFFQLSFNSFFFFFPSLLPGDCRNTTIPRCIF